MSEKHQIVGQDPLEGAGPPIVAESFTADQARETAEWWGALDGD